jgi:predicted  nucleic acid-binding Zn-ribbon protein
VKQTLEMLVELQRLEDELRDLRTAKAELEALERDNAEALEGFDAMLAEQAARIDETKAFCEEKEAEIKETEEANRRSRTRLSGITNQRELNALNKELETQRRLTQQRNEELLKLMEQLEAAQADYAKRKAERDELAEQMKALEAELAARVEDKAALADQYTARRKELRGKLDRGLVSRFDRISRGRDGIAVADVVDGTCTGCRMQVPPQVFIRLQRMESLEQCQSCVRMLVWFAGVDGATAETSAGPPPIGAPEAAAE